MQDNKRIWYFHNLLSYNCPYVSPINIIWELVQNQKHKNEIDNQNQRHFNLIIDLNQRIITLLRITKMDIYRSSNYICWLTGWTFLVLKLEMVQQDIKLFWVSLKVSCNCLYFTDDEMKDELAGSTALCVLLKSDRIFCVSIDVHGSLS